MPFYLKKKTILASFGKWKKRAFCMSKIEAEVDCVEAKICLDLMQKKESILTKLRADSLPMAPVSQLLTKLKQQSLLTETNSSATSSPFENHLKEHLESWSNWKYYVDIKVNGHFQDEEKPFEIKVQINLLQAAIILKDIFHVKLITRIAKEQGKNEKLNNILNHKVIVDEERELTHDWNWILDANSVHLATKYVK